MDINRVAKWFWNAPALSHQYVIRSNEFGFRALHDGCNIYPRVHFTIAINLLTQLLSQFSKQERGLMAW